jgi:hypothetical protein
MQRSQRNESYGKAESKLNILSNSKLKNPVNKLPISLAIRQSPNKMKKNEIVNEVRKSQQISMINVRSSTTSNRSVSKFRNTFKNSVSPNFLPTLQDENPLTYYPQNSKFRGT